MPTLDWIGKQAVVNHHQQVPFHLLKEVPELSCGEPGAGNLIVQGDNLVALKALLPYYAGQVKCIYIDPPYNTGNENWVYNDNVNSPQMRQWLGKTVGGEAEDLSRHDKWLCMIYPRLSLLKQFLRQDGVIFVSLDDTEAHALRYAMDEIFGTKNFISNVIWEKSDSPRMDAHFFSERHDFLVVYARDITRAKFHQIRAESDELPEHYNKSDEQGRKYYLKPLRAMGGQGDSRTARPTLFYPLTAPDGTEVLPKKQDGSDGAWRWKKEKVQAELYRIEWVKGRKGWSPYFRIYGASTAQRPAETIWFHGEVGSNRTSKAELKAVFPIDEPFATPKPLALVKRILQIATNPGDLVLDSFAGSGTTGHAVLQMNGKDSGDRRFILIEMEPKIARDITAERVRRVAVGYTNAKDKKIQGLGGAFRFCTLGIPLFDEAGNVQREVRFADLATHVYFVETGSPLPKRTNGRTPLLGIHQGIGVYLLFNGILGDKTPQGGNVLTAAVLSALPLHDGTRVIYGEGCRLSAQRLKREGIVFKQVPYQIRVD